MPREGMSADDHVFSMQTTSQPTDLSEADKFAPPSMPDRLQGDPQTFR